MSVSYKCYQFLLFSRSSFTESASGFRGRGTTDSLMITCNTSGFNFGFLWINWYSQAPERSCEHVSKISPLGNVKHYTFSLERFVITRNNMKNQLCLQTNRLKQEDSAQYNCAFTSMNHREYKGESSLVGRTNGKPAKTSVIFLQLGQPIPGLHFLPDQTWDYLSHM